MEFQAAAKNLPAEFMTLIFSLAKKDLSWEVVEVSWLRAQVLCPFGPPVITTLNKSLPEWAG